jgi:hypothetical protein
LNSPERESQGARGSVSLAACKQAPQGGAPARKQPRWSHSRNPSPSTNCRWKSSRVRRTPSTWV